MNDKEKLEAIYEIINKKAEEMGISYYITKRSQFLTFNSITDFV